MKQNQKTYEYFVIRKRYDVMMGEHLYLFSLKELRNIANIVISKAHYL